jgi:phosphatidylinositol kinase/protein kinase (PI-3  family)
MDTAIQARTEDEFIPSNVEAERVLLRVSQKLSGHEYGEAFTVEGQVNQLIVEAHDATKLSKMFPGWVSE